MKIIVEDGDDYCGLAPGCYVIAPESVQIDREYDYHEQEQLNTFKRREVLRGVRTTMELRAEVLQREQAPSYTWGDNSDEDLLSDDCQYCGKGEGHSVDCPAGIAEQVPMSANRCDNLNGPCSCGAWHSPRGPMTGRRFDNQGLNFGGYPKDEKRRQFMAAYGIKAEKLVKEDAPFRRGGIAKATGPVVFGNGEPERFVPLDQGEARKEWPRPHAILDGKPVDIGPCPYVLKDDPQSSAAPMTDEQRAAALKWFTETCPGVKADVVYLPSDMETGHVNRAIVDVVERRADDLRRVLGVPKELVDKIPDPIDLGRFVVDDVYAREGLKKVLDALPKCDECGGTGEWASPISGKRSPCSRGCKP